MLREEKIASKEKSKAMNNFIEKLLGEGGKDPSEACSKAFNENFSDAVNIDWHQLETHFEAIFYRNNIEHIALFTREGELLEYRQNLSPEYLPEPLRNLASEKGEIMSTVLRNKGNKLEYEIIYRNTALSRYLLTLS